MRIYVTSRVISTVEFANATKFSARRSRRHRSAIAIFETTAVIHDLAEAHCERSEVPNVDPHAEQWA
jgi:hypothetical protein